MDFETQDRVPSQVMDQREQLQEMGYKGGGRLSRIQRFVNDGSGVRRLAQLQAIIENKKQKEDELVAERESVANSNTVGLPEDLKIGVERLSGYSLDGVKVHYKSGKPATLQAHAYTQGENIYIAPKQEKYLPHETWHVIQQKRRSVEPTGQMDNGVRINDDNNLEKEADVMADKALKLQDPDARVVQPVATRTSSTAPVQRTIKGLEKYDHENEIPDKWVSDQKKFILLKSGKIKNDDEIKKILAEEFQKSEVPKDLDLAESIKLAAEIEYKKYVREDIEIDGGVMGVLARKSSDVYGDSIPELADWRNNKKNALEFEVGEKSMSLYGPGYYIRGGGSYREKIVELRGAVRDLLGKGAGSGEIEVEMKKQLKLSMLGKGELPVADEFAAIVKFAEGARASNNIMSFLNALFNPKLSAVELGKVMKESVVFSKGIFKRGKYDIMNDDAKSWISHTHKGKSAAGSKQSQIYTERGEKLGLKRKGSLDERFSREEENIIEVAGGLVDSSEFLRRGDTGISLYKKYQEYMLSVVGSRARKLVKTKTLA